MQISPTNWAYRIKPYLGRGANTGLANPAPFRMMNDFSCLAVHIWPQMYAPETGLRMQSAALSRLAGTLRRLASRGRASKNGEGVAHPLW